MGESRPAPAESAPSIGQGPARSVRHSLREQDALWNDFLGLAALVVDSVDKSVKALCEGRFDLIGEVEDEEQVTDRREVEIEPRMHEDPRPLQTGRLGLCAAWPRS